MANNPISARLEEIRSREGVRTVQEFVQLVNAGADEPFPYATASRYHTSREPPIAYVRDVLRAFPGVRWEWLVSGEGPVTEAERERDENRRAETRFWERLREDVEEAGEKQSAFDAEIDAALESALPEAHVSPVARAMFVHLWNEIHGNYQLQMQGTLNEPTELAGILAAPIRAMGEDAIPTQLVERFFVQVAPSLTRWINDYHEATGPRSPAPTEED